MNLLKLRFYIEILAIATGITLIICVLPIQAFIEREIRSMTLFCGGILWFIIIYRNETFHYLVQKWFKN